MVTQENISLGKSDSLTLKQRMQVAFQKKIAESAKAQFLEKVENSRYQIDSNDHVIQEIKEHDGEDYERMDSTIMRMRKQQFAKDDKLVVQQRKDQEKREQAAQIAKETAIQHQIGVGHKRNLTLIASDNKSNKVSSTKQTEMSEEKEKKKKVGSYVTA